jgi:biofilm PGA synthesis N-glycosyltransferase PgaC
MNSDAVKKPKVILLLNVYNAAKTLPSFLKSIRNQDFKNFPILAIDDGSTDETVDVLDKSKMEIEIIKLEHVGLRKARSYGVNQADCDILVILDSDLILESTALSELINPLVVNPKVAAVGGVLKNAEKGAISESYGELRKIFLKLRSKKDGEVDWVNGGFCAVRKKVIDEIGGYTQDETSEDLDISWRIRENGYKLYLASKAVAYHKDPTTFGEIWKREFNVGKREFFLSKKHRSQALTIKRLSRFYPILLPIPLILLLIFYWPLLVVSFALSLLLMLFLVKGRFLARLTAWFTFNVMNFAYCTGFILSFFKKTN